MAGMTMHTTTTSFATLTTRAAPSLQAWSTPDPNSKPDNTDFYFAIVFSASVIVTSLSVGTGICFIKHCCHRLRDQPQSIDEDKTGEEESAGMRARNDDSPTYEHVEHYTGEPARNLQTTHFFALGGLLEKITECLKWRGNTTETEQSPPTVPLILSNGTVLRSVAQRNSNLATHKFSNLKDPYKSIEDTPSFDTRESLRRATPVTQAQAGATSAPLLLSTGRVLQSVDQWSAGN